MRSEYVRYINYQTVANWRAKVSPPEYVFCGDSITAGGREWDMRLGWDLFSSLNLGHSGYTVFQVRGEVEKAIQYRPKYIFIMAGTNDALSHRLSLEQTVKDFEEMLALFSASSVRPVVTLIPLTAFSESNETIDALNAQIRGLAAKYHTEIIDLNPELAPKHLLLPNFTVDGVHLSESAYTVWVKKVRSVLHHPPA